MSTAIFRRLAQARRHVLRGGYLKHAAAGERIKIRHAGFTMEQTLTERRDELKRRIDRGDTSDETSDSYLAVNGELAKVRTTLGSLTDER